jgi:hypothetical protein
MKRDMDLCRQILLRVEAMPANGPGGVIDVPGYASEDINYQVKLMAQHNLLEAVDLSGNGPLEWHVVSMTWDGHDFLDATRNDTIWKKVKTEMKDRGVALTFELTKALAVKYLTAQIGLNGGAGK